MNFNEKMNVLIILGHPDKKSFNHAIAQRCIMQIEANGHAIFFHDLYAEKFNPLLYIDNENPQTEIDNQIKEYCDDLINSDGIIVIHPNWWGQPPAIIKGWMDRVLLPGIAYDFKLNNKGDYIPVGLLKAKSGLILTTSNTPNNYEDNILDTIWKNNVFNICGVNEVKRINFGMVKESSDEHCANWLLEVKQLVNSIFPTNK